MAHRNVTGLPRRHTQRYADQFGAHFVQTGSLGIHRHQPAFVNPVNPDLQGRGISDAFIPLKRHRYSHSRSSHRFHHHRGRHPKLIRQPLGHSAEFHQVQEPEQRLWHRIADLKAVQPEIQFHMAIQRHQLARQQNLCHVIDQSLAALFLLDLARAGQQRIQIAVFVNQQGSSLDPDPRRTGHVIHAIPGQCLHIHHPLWPDAELFNHPIAVDALVLHRVEHFDAIADQLHHVLVRCHNRHPAPGIAGLTGQGGDDVVGLEPGDLLAGDIKRTGRVAGQRELRHQILGGRRALRLVQRIQVIAERPAGMVKDNSHMRRCIRASITVNIALQHVHEPRHRPHRQPIRFAGQGRQGVIGTENKR